MKLPFLFFAAFAASGTMQGAVFTVTTAADSGRGSLPSGDRQRSSKMKTPRIKRSSPIQTRFGTLAILLAAMAPLRAATLTVQNTADSGAGSLRQALAVAQPGDTVNFAIPQSGPGYDPATDVHTLSLTTGELQIRQDLTIDGTGAKISISRSASAPVSRIVRVFSGNVRLLNLTITRGGGEGVGAVGYVAGGGGIENAGVLTVQGCTIVDNSGTVAGGIYNEGSLTIRNSTLLYNRGFDAGGVYNAGTLRIDNSTIVDNRGCRSCGAQGTGGIHQRGALATIRNTVIARNLRQTGGGFPASPDPVRTGPLRPVASASVETEFHGPPRAQDYSPDDVNGAFTSHGHNLLGTNARSTGFSYYPTNDQFGSDGALLDPRLGPLQDNGGSTSTRAPLAGSPLLDRGSRGADTNGFPINVDQRGQPRPFDNPALANGGGDGSDIGAVEVGEPLEGPTFTVTNTAQRDGECTADDCTLLEALNAANAAADANTIRFAPGVSGTIFNTLVPAGLNLVNPVTIEGPGAGLLTISGNNGARIFFVHPGIEARISGVTLAAGSTTNSDGGGALLNRGALYLKKCAIINSAAPSGGGLANFGGFVEIIESTFSGNQASVRGGAIRNVDEATLTLTRSTVSNNRSVDGGGIHNAFAGFTSDSSTISGNTVSSSSVAGSGGGIYNFNGGVTLIDSTVSGNTALGPGGNSSSGGGILTNAGDVNIINSTITANSADIGGGIRNLNSSALDARSSIVALNTSPFGPDIAGALTSENFNLIGNSSGATISPSQPADQIGVTAAQLNLGPLQQNGGATRTHALLAGSRAIDKGASGDDTTDQRGLSRPLDLPDVPNAVGGDGTDVGAFEFGANAAPPVVLVNVASRKLHGTSGLFDIDLPAGTLGVECRSGGATRDLAIVFRFLNPVSSVGGVNFTGTGNVSGGAIGSDPFEYLVNLTAVGNAQVVTVTLSNVADAAGNQSPTVGRSFGVLVGDTTGNGAVSASDIGQTKGQSGQPVTAANFRTDVTANGGSINASDIGLTKSASGTQLP